MNDADKNNNDDLERNEEESWCLGDELGLLLQLGVPDLLLG